MISTLPNLRSKDIFILALIIMAGFASFWPALSNGFVLWDDPAYILENQLAHTLSWANTKRIFSTYILGNYQPLTILSFSLEHYFFGLDPFPYHLTNIILHAANAVLVYLLIMRLCARAPIAILTTLLFTVHPMRVESAVWVTERKDVLFAFFYLLGLLQYGRYLQRNKVKHLFITFLFFVLSLLAKPTAVSFPLAVVLLDYIQPRRLNARTISEKIPFFLTALVFGIIAIFGTYTPANEAYPIADTITGTLHQTIVPLDQIKFSEEQFTFLDNALITCHALVRYIVRTVWPYPLSPYYPLPKKMGTLLPFDYYLAAGVVLLIILFLVRWYNKPARFCALFFFVTVFFNLPVGRIGSVEIADRFTYIPSIGLFYFLAMAITAAVVKLQFTRPALNIILKAAVALLVFSSAANTFFYAKTWKNSGKLWTAVINLYPADPKGYFNRGNYFFDRRDYKRAVRDYRTAIILNPSDPRVHFNLGNSYLYLGRPELAIQTYDTAMAVDVQYTRPLRNRSIAVDMLKKMRGGQ
jgi:tetratricopeptide (TPR) repeat protein